MSTSDFRLIDLIDDMCSGSELFFRFVRAAKDIMIQHVETLTLDHTVEEALVFMRAKKVRHVPVMDLPIGDEQKSYFVGVVSERDLFRQISPYVGKVGELESDQTALQRKLADIVSRKPESVSPDTPMADVMAAMIDRRADMLPVLVNRELVGIITGGDIVKLFVRLDTLRQFCTQAGETTRLVDLFSGGASAGTAQPLSLMHTVRDIMTQKVVYLGPDDTITKALVIMQQGRFRHVPIVDDAGKVIGIVSDRDVLLNLTFPSAKRRPNGSGFRTSLFSVDSRDPSLKLPLRRIMKSKVECVLPSCEVCEAAKKLQEMKVSCLPVIDEQHRVHGILTVTDLMRALLAVYKLTQIETHG